MSYVIYAALGLVQAAATALAFGPSDVPLSRKLLVVSAVPLCLLALGAAAHLIATVGDPPYMCLIRGGVDQAVCSQDAFMRQQVLLFGIKAIPLVFASILATISLIRFVPVVREIRRTYFSPKAG